MNSDNLTPQELNAQNPELPQSSEGSSNNPSVENPAEISETNSENPTEISVGEESAANLPLIEESPFATMDLEGILAEMEKIAHGENAPAQGNIFSQLRKLAEEKIRQENKQIDRGQAPEQGYDEMPNIIHPQQQKLDELVGIMKEKLDTHQQQQTELHAKHLEHRRSIVERLKQLNANAEPGTNFFKEMRKIKDDWAAAGKVSKNDFKLINNDYYHHLSQFHEMLQLNRGYLEQEYAHNLEKRQHIIARAQELEKEPSVQKALNELQYLHKLWREEAEPVAEEHRESTWEAFREASGKVHERRSELHAQQEAEQQQNFSRKNEIIAEIKQFAANTEQKTHQYWQSAIKKVEALREEFFHLGGVPKEHSAKNWAEVKEALRSFNTEKNNFYRNLKGSQSENLAAKQNLIDTAKANQNSEDWATALPLFKKLQEDWKTIGHVPRNVADKMYAEFREACNVFFENYRAKSGGGNDDWKQNLRQKQQILAQLESMADAEHETPELLEIKNQWEAAGKVPRENMDINGQFNRLYRLKAGQQGGFERESRRPNRREGGQNTIDPHRKLRQQITDLENEIATLENNVGFFGRSSKDNPLLADTYARIDKKKEQVASLRQQLKTIISEANNS